MRNPTFASLVVGSIALGASACGTGTDRTTATENERTASAQSALGGGQAILPRLPATPTVSASTVPSNGDLNPYGVAFVPDGFSDRGILREGDVIVANFNNAANLQGTGTTIVRVNANASPSVFFQDSATPGLSTALGVLRRGFVLVGNVPSTDGSGVCTEGDGGAELNVGHGALSVVNVRGKLVKTLTRDQLLDGPWDLALDDEGERALVFVSNVLSGTVTRLTLRLLRVREESRAEDERVIVEDATQIASGYVHRCDPAAFVVGPTGLAFDKERDTLYVASTGDNAIFAIERASETRRDRGTCARVVTDQVHLHGPLGLARARNGDLISAQGDAVNPDPNQPSEIVEFTATGEFVAQFSIDPAPGSAFGLALEKSHRGFRFAAVDDGLNVLHLWDVK